MSLGGCVQLDDWMAEFEGKEATSKAAAAASINDGWTVVSRKPVSLLNSQARSPKPSDTSAKLALLKPPQQCSLIEIADVFVHCIFNCAFIACNSPISSSGMKLLYCMVPLYI